MVVQKKARRYSAGLFRKQLLEASQDHEFVATILGSAILFATRGASRTLFAKSSHAQSRAIDSAISEIAVRDCRATLAEREVVFVRPAVVSVALDSQLHVWIALQCVNFLIEKPHSVFGDLRTIELEIKRSRNRFSIAGVRLGARRSFSRRSVRIIGVGVQLCTLALCGFECGAAGGSARRWCSCRVMARARARHGGKRNQ